MKKIRILLFILSVLLTGNCGFIIISPPGQWEKADKFKVKPGTTPSELMKKFLGDNAVKERNNYCIVFFDIYCGQTAAHYFYCNRLHKKTKDSFDWLAVTMYDAADDNKWRKKLNIADDSLRYNFPTYYSINGLRSSMRNVYHNNVIPDNDISSMVFIVVNDSIKHHSRGGLHTREKYSEHKNVLDSLSQINKHLHLQEEE